MGYKEYKPCEELKIFIKCFWIMEKDYDYYTKSNGLEYLWATGLTEILYIRGSNFSSLNGEILPNQIVIGAYNKGFTLKNKGKVKIIGIRCYNHGARILFNINLNNLINKIERFEFENININILNSSDNIKIIEYLNDYCKKRISTDENIFLNILYELYNDEYVSLQSLYNKSNLSLRQFERKVKKNTGFTPKQLMTIVRFDKARIKMLFTRDYLQVMTDLGYYDYAHFSKDFKKYFGITPKKFIDTYNKY